MKGYFRLLAAMLALFAQSSLAQTLPPPRLSLVHGLLFPPQTAERMHTIVVSPQTTQAAQVTLSAPSGTRFYLHALPNKITLHCAQSSQTVQVDNWQIAGAALHQQPLILLGAKNSTQQLTLSLGATLSIPPHRVACTYSGFLPLLANDEQTVYHLAIPIAVRVIGFNGVEKNRDLSFPTVMSHFAGELVVNPYTQNAASFLVIGTPNAQAQASISPKKVQLETTTGSQKIQVSTFRFGSSDGDIDSSTGEFTFPNGVGGIASRVILVGATADFKRTLSAGTYHGQAVLQVVYE